MSLTTTYTINNTQRQQQQQQQQQQAHRPQPLNYSKNHLASYDQYDYLCKLLLIGDSGCGKTSVLKRFSDDEFNVGYASTIGVDFEVRTVDVGAKKVKLQMWDSAGQERFRTITTSYYRGSNAVLIVFDVTQEDSFRNIHKWLQEFRTVHAGAIGQTTTQIMLVANKCDLVKQRVVESHRIEELANELHIPYIETSAKTNTNVSAAFHTIASNFVRQRMIAESADPRWGAPGGPGGREVNGIRLSDDDDGSERSAWKRCFGACSIM